MLDLLAECAERATRLRRQGTKVVLVIGAEISLLNKGFLPGDTLGERMELNPDDTRALILGAVSLARLGERERSLDMANRALSVDPDDSALLYNVACVYCSLGENERAIEVLERSVDRGFGQREWIETDPDLAPLRGTPRYEAILKAM